jgi:hypothetical protein
MFISRLTGILILVLSSFNVSAFNSDQVILTKTASPVPFGKITYIVGEGYKNSDPNIKMIRIPDGDRGYPSELKQDLNHFRKDFKAKSVEILQSFENIFTVSLPKEEFGMAILFDSNSNDETKPLVFNNPELQWLSTDRVSPGEIVRAIGKNLVPISKYPERDSLGKPVSYAGYIAHNSKVLLKDKDGLFISASIVKASSYDIHFQIPVELIDGIYKVYIHNGHGGKYGWSDSQELKIEGKRNWSSKVFNVRDFGAVGDSRKDDTDAILKAIEAIRANKGGVLYFPAGGYHFNATLRLPDKTIVRGESKERSWIYMPDGFHTNAQSDSVKIGIAGEGSIGLEDLSIHAVYVKMIVVAPVGDKLPESWMDYSALHDVNNVFEKSADDSFIKNCRILQNSTHLYHRRPDYPKNGEYFKSDQNLAVLLKGDRISVTDSEIIGRQSCLYLADSKYSRIANNTMYSGYNGNNIALQYGNLGYEKIIIEDNYLSAFSPFHHGSVWMMHGGRYISMFRNEVNMKTWVSDNEGLLGHMWGYRLPFFIEKAGDHYIDINVDKWIAYWNKIKENAPNLIQYAPFSKKGTDQNDFEIYVGHELQVFRGTGFGQVNKVSKVKANRIYFEKPFDLRLDTSSILVVHDAPAFRHLIFADNKIEDTGQAIFLWGHSHESVIDGNITRRTGPIGAWTVFHAFSVAGGCHFFQMINNYMDEGRYYTPGGHQPGGRYSQGGIGAHYSCESEWASSGGALNSVGYIVRNNYFENDNSVNYGGYDYTWCGSKLDSAEDKDKNPVDMIGLIFQGNTFKDCKYGMVFGSTVKAVTKDNDFTNVETPILGKEFEGIIHSDNLIREISKKQN